MRRRRCACRPGCLSWLSPDDKTVETPAGLTLTAHVDVQPYPDELDEVDAEVAS